MASGRIELHRKDAARRRRCKHDAGGAAATDRMQVRAARLPGFYHIHVVPNGGTGSRSVHVSAIAASRGTDKGQTLATVAMD